jgi:phage/plasmid-like protein (TIGR03299 family)
MFSETQSAAAQRQAGATFRRTVQPVARSAAGRSTTQRREIETMSENTHDTTTPAGPELPQIGTYVGPLARNTREAIEAAGLGWRVGMYPAFRGLNEIGSEDSGADTDAAAPVDIAAVESRQWIVRQDTGQVTGNAAPGYTPFQNESAFAFLDPFVSQGATFGMCGELGRGSGVFITLDLGDPVTVRRPDGSADVIGKTVWATLFHNGHGAFKLGLMGDRMFCRNQIPAILSARDQRLFTFSHSASIEARVNQAREAFVTATGYFDELADLGTALAAEPFSRDEMIAFSKALILGDGDDAKKIEELGKRARTNAAAQIDQFVNLFEHGQGNRGESKWDALQGVYEFVDHHKAVGARAANAQARLAARADDLFSGAGSRMKRRARQLLTRSA